MLDGVRPAIACIILSFSANAPAQPRGMLTSKFIAQYDNTFRQIANFLLPNPLDVKNVVVDYLAIESWEKVYGQLRYAQHKFDLKMSVRSFVSTQHGVNVTELYFLRH